MSIVHRSKLFLLCVVLLQLTPFMEAANAATARPSVGQCWSATGQQASDWSSWQGPAASSCTAAHTLVSWAVVDVKGNFAAVASDQVYGEFTRVASNSCPLSRSPIPVKSSRVIYYLFVPTIDEYNRGDRWVRCDLAIAAIGSTSDKSNLETMTRNLDAQIAFIKSNRKLLSLCYKSYSSTASTLDPATGNAYEIVDCSSRPIWAWGKTIVHKTKKFPYSGNGFAKFTKQCQSLAPKGSGWGRALLWHPTASSWALGDRSTQCFFLLK